MPYNLWTPEEVAIVKNYMRAADASGVKQYPAKEIRTALLGAGFDRPSREISRKCKALQRATARREKFEAALGNEAAPSHPASVFPRREIHQVPSRLDQQSQTARRGHAAKMQILKDLPGEAHELRCDRTPGKGLIISDTHGHLMRVDAVRAAVLSNLDAEWVCVLGDVFDFYSLSVFSKSVRIPLIAEWDLVGQLVMSLSSVFPRVIIVRGNHDARPQSLVLNMLKAQVESLPFVRGLMDPLGWLRDGVGFTPEGELAEVYHWPGTVEYSAAGVADSEGAVVRVGGALLSHADRYLGGGMIDSPLRTAAVVSSELSQKRGEQHDALIQAHTHALGSTCPTNDRFLAECGCMSDKPGYVINKKLKYKKQIIGWVELYQGLDGQVDLERSGHRYYGRGLVQQAPPAGEPVG